MKKLLLVGGGGHCKSVIDSLIVLREFEIVGILDSPNKIGENVMGVPIIGCDDDSAQLYSDGIDNAFITVGSVGNIILRRKLYTYLKKLGFKFPSILDVTATISNNAYLGEGTFVGKGAIINANVSIGNMCIINTGAIIDHDCIIKDFSHLAPRTVLSGNVNIGMNTHIGVGTTIIENITIGKDTIIGAGSVVTTNLENNSICYGNPCRKVRENTLV